MTEKNPSVTGSMMLASRLAFPVPLTALRKAGAARAASNGATVAQLEAIFGWHDGGRMAALCTEICDRVRIAKEAIGKLARNEI